MKAITMHAQRQCNRRTECEKYAGKDGINGVETDSKVQIGNSDIYYNLDMDEMHLDFLKNKKKSSRIFHQCRKIIVILLMIFVASSGIALFLNSDASYGMRSTVQNVKHFFAPEKEPAMDDTGLEELKVTDWTNVKNGKAIVKKLFLPEYVPKEYIFENVHFLNSDGMSTTLYTYLKDDAKLLISIESMEGEWDVYFEGEVCIDSRTGRKSYVVVDKETGVCTTNYPDGENVFAVSGTLAKEENAKIIDNLKRVDWQTLEINTNSRHTFRNSFMYWENPGFYAILDLYSLQ